MKHICFVLVSPLQLFMGVIAMKCLSSSCFLVFPLPKKFPFLSTKVSLNTI